MFKRLSGIVLVLALMVGGIGFLEFQSAGVVKADTGDSLVTFFGAGTSTGTVITASTGHRLIIKDAYLTSTASTTIVLQEHPSSGSNITIANIGVLANTPVRIDPTFLNVSAGGGFVTGSGSSLVAFNQNVAAGTLSLSIRYALN